MWSVTTLNSKKLLICRPAGIDFLVGLEHKEIIHTIYYTLRKRICQRAPCRVKGSQFPKNNSSLKLLLIE